MIGSPMPMPRSAARSQRASSVLSIMLLGAVLAACASTPSASPQASVRIASPAGSLPPTPQPTPRFTNLPDPTLAALIPSALLGRAVTVPPITDFGLTPGDVGGVYGELGLRFHSLQLAFIGRPHLLSLYAVGVDPPIVATVDLEPYLATAGQYVGVAGLHREPWTLRAIGGHQVWARPGDEAMITGATVYTWAAGGYLFLLVGVDPDQDAAMLAVLPGEAAAVPSAATPSAGPSGG